MPTHKFIVSIEYDESSQPMGDKERLEMECMENMPGVVIVDDDDAIIINNIEVEGI